MLHYAKNYSILLPSAKALAENIQKSPFSPDSSIVGPLIGITWEKEAGKTVFAENGVESEIKLQRQPEGGRSWLQQRQMKVTT